MYKRCLDCGFQYDEKRVHVCAKKPDAVIAPKKSEAAPKKEQDAERYLARIAELEDQLANHECPVCEKRKVKNRERVAAWREKNGSK
jgi:hypothetical protein